MPIVDAAIQAQIEALMITMKGITDPTLAPKAFSEGMALIISTAIKSATVTVAVQTVPATGTGTGTGSLS